MMVHANAATSHRKHTVATNHSSAARGDALDALPSSTVHADSYMMRHAQQVTEVIASHRAKPPEWMVTQPTPEMRKGGATSLADGNTPIVDDLTVLNAHLQA